jgi:dTDP-glucose pyrophosphorylase
MKKEIADRIRHIIIQFDDDILSALKKMDQEKVKLLIVHKGNQFFGLLSIGDIQRAIVNKIPLSTQLQNILRKEITVAREGESFQSIKDKMMYYRTECMPVVGHNNNLVDIYFWNEVFSLTEKIDNRQLNLPVVVMAGGKGERMKPLTNIIPKPLIPVGEKTILETILDKFHSYGCSEFYISVNYKAELIKKYFEDLHIRNYTIAYFQEEKPLGTIGSLTLLKNKIRSTFFVSNCDIILDQDLREIYDYHVKNNNEITIVAALKHYKIPYGVIEIGENGLMTELNEKPELTFMINSGVYIMEPDLIDEIPEDSFFHITHLINKVKERNGRIGVFPVSQGSWTDVGDWAEYSNFLEKLKIDHVH